MVTAEEIEHRISEAYRLNQATMLRFEQPGLGRISVNIEELSGASLIQNAIVTEKSYLQILCQRIDPMMLMYFQLKGGSMFVQSDAVRVPERHHSLSFYPDLQIAYRVGEYTCLNDIVIKFKPEVVAAQLLEEGMPGDDWQRLLELGDQPYVTVQRSQQMNPQMLATVYQLLNCPYKGKLGQAYKDSLVRLLLIEQLLAFQQGRQVSVDPDTRLTRRDIDTLHAVKAYLDQHYLDELSLEKIVKLFGLNTFKLKYGFRKLFDTSVMRYIDDQKMAYARRLLLDEKQEVWTVADQLGYNHYTNFSTAFKRRFGYSPAQLKEQPLLVH